MRMFVFLFDLKLLCAPIKKDTKVGTIRKDKEPSALFSIAPMKVTQRSTCTVQTAKTWICYAIEKSWQGRVL